MSVRVVVALIVAGLVCIVGALILGEYQFTGLTPFAAGLLFGLVVSEFVLEIGKTRSPLIGIVTGAMVAGALGWAAWISSGEGLRPFPTLGWVAMALGALAAGGRTGGWGARRSGRDVRAAE
ncbi:MAG TPA: hypothetical protein VGJ03_05705 [Acidimicrobiales bacterium]|jgi:hypothetical protein